MFTFKNKLSQLMIMTQPYSVPNTYIAFSVSYVYLIFNTPFKNILVFIIDWLKNKSMYFRPISQIKQFIKYAYYT